MPTLNTLSAACEVTGEIALDPATSLTPAAAAGDVEMRGGVLRGRKP
jgi:hypothetical protein